MTLSGKSVMITGGNSEIGLATALCFAGEGADVAILSCSADRNKAARAKIEALGARCVTFAGSVTNEDDVRSAVYARVAAFDGLEYAFNCAGLSQSVTPIETLRLDEFTALTDVNARGTFLAMKYQIPAMRSGWRRDLQLRVGGRIDPQRVSDCVCRHQVRSHRPYTNLH